MTKKEYASKGIPTKSFSRNGITIYYPAGYATFEDYVEVLHINLNDLRDLAAGRSRATLMSEKKILALIERYENDIKEAGQALA